jgi:hypothetical protein
MECFMKFDLIRITFIWLVIFAVIDHCITMVLRAVTYECIL